MPELDDALAADDWPRALAAAISAWRDMRSVELADLVDRITAKCELPKPPHTRANTHDWWMNHAIDPDPVTTGALIATFPVRLQVEDDLAWHTMRTRWSEPNPIIAAIEAVPAPNWWREWREKRGLDPTFPDRVANWVDRLAAAIRWPDDPRLSRLFVDLLAHPEVKLYGGATQAVMRVLADRLIALADHRVGPWLAKIVETNKSFVTHKQGIVNPLVTEITGAIAAPVAIEPRVASSLPALPAVDLAPLWQEVVDRPDDDAPRLVLADAMIAGGDNRGELIVLQCVTDEARRGRARVQAQRLMRSEWRRWMGDLTLILARKGTEVARGMLHKIRVGLSSTPDWAWDAVRDHRELLTVREVRPAHVYPVQYGRFLAQLPRPPRMVAFDAPEVIEMLIKHDARLPLVEVFFSPVSALVHYRMTRPAFENLFRKLARVAPTIEVLELGHLWWLGPVYRPMTEVEQPRFAEMLNDIPHAFPNLRVLRVHETSIPEEARPSVRAVKHVELIPPPRRTT